jgi:alpha-pyrone synthase
MSSYITAIGTANPENCFEQGQIAEFMVRALQLNTTDARKLQALYRSTKIKTRYSVLADYGQPVGQFEFYPNTSNLEPFPSVSQRMSAYRQFALPLALKAIKHLEITYLSQNIRTPFPAITHLITVSCTGMYAPGLDIELIQALALNYSVQRTAVNFMGCYGAFNGLKVADAVVRANPEAVVLVVCLELCTLHFQKKNEVNHLLSNALFADGAAAVLVEGQPRANSLQMRAFYCDLLPQGRNDMAWQISDFGFEMVLTSYVPKLVKSGIKQLVERLRAQAKVENFDFYAIHPGGRAILEATEQELALSPAQNQHAYDILRDFGNMSSATVLFVLQKLMQHLTPADHQKTIFSCAFGPGLTLESSVFEVVSA